jgi:O-antigen biosynthesis protein
VSADNQRRSKSQGRVVAAFRLANDAVLITGWCRPPVNVTAPIVVSILGGSALVYPRSIVEVSDDDGHQGRLGPSTAAPGFIGVVGMPLSEPHMIDIVAAPVLLEFARVEVFDLGAFGWTAVAGTDAATRNATAAFVARAQQPGADPKRASVLATQLAAFRDAVRERPPHCRIAVDSAQGLFVADIHRLGECGYYVKGWMRDIGSEHPRLIAVSPEGSRTELDRVVRFARDDVAEFYGRAHEVDRKAGFLSFVEIDAPSHLASGWIIELIGDDGVVVEAGAPDVIDDATGAQALLLGDLVHATQGSDDMMRDHVHPAFEMLQRRRADDNVIRSVTQFGTPPMNPDVSLIIPLYQRIDFVEHQMAQWCRDPYISTCDLIYVLDSPEQAEGLLWHVDQLFALYGVPFRVVILERNVGYANANNAGASLAVGRMLLLLNSDVIPDKPGWLAELVDRFDSTPDVGAMGPKLVYEDGSIQHAGMYFERPNGTVLWENRHYYKGLHRTFPAANISRAVPAVTGACLLMARALWDEIGGLRGTYVQGDYEDSDLCLRLAAIGFSTWYVADIELFHLEGQSYPSAMRRITSMFNTWLHSHLWSPYITAVMEQHNPSPLPPRSARHAPSAAMRPAPPRSPDNPTVQPVQATFVPPITRAHSRTIGAK